MWIFGFLITGNYLVTAAFIGAYILAIQRVATLEARWEMVNKQAAEILHSPHTPELDILLEKLVRTYEDRHYELSTVEWSSLQSYCQGIKEDVTEPKGTRLLAGMIYSLCCHKLMVSK